MFKSYEIEMNNFFKIHVSEQVLDMFNEAKMKVVVISFGSLKVNLKSNHVNCMYSEITVDTFVKTYENFHNKNRFSDIFPPSAFIVYKL